MSLFRPPHACFRCAHSSSSLPLQSAAYASASTRSLCAPQCSHNAVSFCPVCSPVLSPGLEIRRARAPPATPARSRTFSCVGRLPSALLRTTCALSKFSTVLPLWQARRRVAASNALACRQLPHCWYRKKWVCTEIDSLLSRATDVPALEHRFLDYGLPDLTGKLHFSRVAGPSGDQADNRLGNV